MSEKASNRPLQFSLRAMLSCVAGIGVLVFLCSGGCETIIDRILLPTTIFSKDSFSPNEEATLTSRVKTQLPPNARVVLASYDKHFGPGGGNITVCVTMPEDEAGLFLKAVDGMKGTVYRPLSCRLPEWREARDSIEELYSTPDCHLYFSKPVGGEVSVYYVFEDYDGRCSEILFKGKRRWPLPRERFD